MQGGDASVVWMGETEQILGGSGEENRDMLPLHSPTPPDMLPLPSPIPLSLFLSLPISPYLSFSQSLSLRVTAEVQLEVCG